MYVKNFWEDKYKIIFINRHNEGMRISFLIHISLKIGRRLINRQENDNTLGGNCGY